MTELTDLLGWRAAFVVLGALGLVWLVAWFWLYEVPEWSRRVSAAERAHIHRDPPAPEMERLPWPRWR
ncbi:MAG: hypothetical protein V9H26_23875 [Verrucomicrobiota bacterium]|nr:hypothetical protein [Verrucomicrobiota bacterium]MCC6822304.1 hypothetical protein [Limisphaerales bacterium]